MLNLILNAIEAMVGVDAEVRELVISTESSPSQGLLVTVGDSGPGIAPEDRERIFESFYTTKSGGAGNRPVDMPLHHRCPRRKTVGGRPSAARRSFQIHAASPPLNSSRSTGGVSLFN